MIYVLTHEYSDKSGFSICGITENPKFAAAWADANDENNVYPIEELDQTMHWMKGFDSWKQVTK